MKKNYSFKTAFIAVIMMAAFVSASAQTTNVATIAELNTANSSLAYGITTVGTFTLTGEVVITFISTSASGVKTMYIQDATGACMIYDSGKLMATGFNVYDGVTGLTGKIQNFHGSFELIPSFTPSAPTSVGHTPYDPIVTTLDHLIDYPLQVATVKGVTITDFTTYISGTTTYTPNGTFQKSTNFPLSIGGVTSTTVLRTAYADANYIGAALPTTALQDITGLVLPYQSSATATYIVDFIPRSSLDIIPSSTSGFSSPKADVLSLSLAGRSLTVNNVANGTTVDIYSAVGARVQSAQLQGGAVQMNNLAKGLYIVRVGNLSSKIVL
jgi:hypothetical protein